MSAAEVTLSSQLATCATEFRHATEEARNLLTYTDEETLRKRRRQASWSALECVVHLNLANQAMLPGLREAVQAAQGSVAKTTYRMDFPGRFLAWSLEPPPLIKLKSAKMVEPLDTAAPEAVLLEFEKLHTQLIELLYASEGKAIDQQKMKSPFADMHYNAYSAFRIISAHDRRHLWQARKALGR